MYAIIKIINHSTDNSLPYSTVLEIKSSSLVVICGQVAEDKDDNIIGATIQEQAEQTFKNCQEELYKAGYTFNDVFKVNVYVKNIDDWGEFNEVFKKYFNQDTKPVRTTVQSGLLSDFLIEIELWAAK